MLSDTDHVVWDWNGTLLDDVHLAVDIVNGMLADYGLPQIDVARYREVFDFPVRRYYERLGFERAGASFEDISHRFVLTYEARVGECSLHRDVRATLEQLAARGVSCSVLSAAQHDTLQGWVDRYEVRGFFTAAAGVADHYARGKVDAGRAWLETAGHDPARAVIVGDTVHDYEVAEALGMRCVLTTRGHHPVDKLAGCNCPVVDSFAELA